MKQITELYGQWFPRKCDDFVLEGPESDITLGKYVHVRYAAELVSSLIREKRERLYTGKLKGSRTSMTKRILKNVNYWLKRLQCTKYPYPRYKYEITRDGVDSLGNPYMSLVIEDSWDNRFYVQVFSVLSSALVAGRFTRLMVKLFSKWHSYLNDKFDVYCMTKMRVYVNPGAYIDVPVYTFKVTSGIVETYDPSIEWEKGGNYATRVNYFRPEYQIPGS